MFRGNQVKRSMAFTLLAPCTILTIPIAASAQSEFEASRGVEILEELNGWEIRRMGPECGLFAPEGDDGLRLSLSQFRGEAPILEIVLGQALAPDVGSVEMQIGNQRERMGISRSREGLHLFFLPTHLIEAMKRGREVELRADGRIFAAVSLTGSSAALDGFERCVQTLPSGPLMPPPAPPPIRPRS